MADRRADWPTPHSLDIVIYYILCTFELSFALTFATDADTTTIKLFVAFFVDGVALVCYWVTRTNFIRLLAKLKYNYITIVFFFHDFHQSYFINCDRESNPLHVARQPVAKPPRQPCSRTCRIFHFVSVLQGK